MPVAGRHSKVHKFKIVLSQAEEVAYWARTLQTTEDELRAAISEVGDHALRVREHLDALRRDPAPAKSH